LRAVNINNRIELFEKWEIYKTLEPTNYILIYKIFNVFNDKKETENEKLKQLFFFQEMVCINPLL
jgi:hypothetical protein